MNIALILSGGTGTRLGANIPKQYIKVMGRPIISYCLDMIAEHPMIDAIQIVSDKTWHKFIVDSFKSDKFQGFSVPGENRQLSIFNGLTDIMKYAANEDYVFIHDAARPLITSEIITLCLNAAHKHEGALPVLPMKDTLYFSENGELVSQLIDRNRIFAGQTPEAFVLGKYYHANSVLMPDKILKINGSTEPAIMAGMNIAMIPGDENNFKITTKADFERFEGIIRNR